MNLNIHISFCLITSCASYCRHKCSRILVFYSVEYAPLLDGVWGVNTQNAGGGGGDVDV